MPCGINRGELLKPQNRLKLTYANRLAKQIGCRQQGCIACPQAANIVCRAGTVKCAHDVGFAAGAVLIIGKFERHRPPVAHLAFHQAVDVPRFVIARIGGCPHTIALIHARNTQREHIGMAVIGAAGVISGVILHIPKVVSDTARPQGMASLIRATRMRLCPR